MRWLELESTQRFLGDMVCSLVAMGTNAAASIHKGPANVLTGNGRKQHLHG